MKNFYLIIIVLISTLTQAQIVNIPDANFKNALINTNCVDINGDAEGDIDADTNNDGEIQVSEAEAVIGLYVSYQEILSLEGIQSFINLEGLDCSHNQLTSINVTQSQNLLYFYCQFNQLTSIDVSQNPNLDTLQCVGNQLTTINTSQNPNLTWYACGNNLLEYLDVTQNPNLLVLGFHLNQLNTIDLTQNTDLLMLDCRGNQMESLFLNQNPSIYEIWCFDNLLTSLDLSQNTNLEWLYSYNNQLTSLNIKNGNNSNTHTIWTYGNPNLSCIQVDDETATYPDCGTNDIFGWCKDDFTQYSEDCNLSSEDFSTITYTIYPNPAQNILNIQTTEKIEAIKIFSLHGQLIKENASTNIEVSTLSSGLYFVQITIEGKTSNKKFVKL